MNDTSNTTGATDLHQEITLLEENLHRQLKAHRQLLACIERNREAIRRADMKQIRSICEQENTVAQHLAELEKVRLVLVGRVTERLEPDAGEPVSMGRIAEALDGPAAGRFEALAAQLRAMIKEVRTASAVVRTAADALARHMGGLLQTVHSALGRAKVYGRRGMLVTGEQNQFCLDIKS